MNQMKKIVEKMIKETNFESMEEKKTNKLKELQNKLRSKRLITLLSMYGSFDGALYSKDDIVKETGYTKREITKKLKWLEIEYPEIYQIIKDNKSMVERVFNRETRNRFLTPDLEYDDDTMSEYIEEQF